MADNTNHTGDPSDGGVRRRRSLRVDEDNEYELVPVEASTPQHASAQQPQDPPTPPAGSRVRFSQDVERDPGRLDGIEETVRRSDEQAGRTEGQNGTGAGRAEERPRAYRRPELSVTVPKGRHRGHSLRSALFRSHVDVKSPDIELQAGPSSSSQASSYPERPTSEKEGRPSVTINPVIEDDVDAKASDNNDAPVLPRYESLITAQTRRKRIQRSVAAAYEKVRNILLRISEIPPSKDGRHIELRLYRTDLTDERTGKPFIDNHIRSSRYTFWNFFPRQLFAQFSKLANFYFLCVSILQMIPGLSTTGTYTTIVPLIFFVALSMGKEGYDDLRRYKLDKAENNQEVTTLRPGQGVHNEAGEELGDEWTSKKWRDVKVSDILRIERDEPIPADLLLLYSGGAHDVAYIDTMALDGETNLKTKLAAPGVAPFFSNTKEVAEYNARITVEDPNIDLYSFNGRLEATDKMHPLTNTEIIYRGSVLRNTPYIYGLVIYTGEECKIRMNANKNPRIKAPALQSVVNKIVIIIVIFVILLAIFNTVAYQLWSRSTERGSWYLTDAKVAFFPILASFIIMFNTMIPLSLYVSMEIVKLSQMFLLNDIDMYDEVSDTPFEARTSTINEELGQISYVFSDKTGTLTDNVMNFRKMSVAGVAFVHDADLKKAPKRLPVQRKKSKGKKPMRRESADVERRKHTRSEVSPTLVGTEGGSVASEQWKSSALPDKPQFEMKTAELIAYIQRKPYTVFARKAKLFLLSIALCHTCLPEVGEDGDVDFQAASPDELALVRAAKDLGFLVIDRQQGTISLKLSAAKEDPTTETYQVLDVVDFSSKRKRMSVVVRFPDQRICVFCKGADSAVSKLLKLSSLAAETAADIDRKNDVRKSLEANEALRRRSEQIDNRDSLHRTSFALGRTSMSGAGRTSFTGAGPSGISGLARTSLGIGRPSLSGIGRHSSENRMQPVRDQLDTWLSNREHDVDASSFDDRSIYYSPRPSAQYRRSMAYSDGRTSFQEEEGADDLVEESLAVDDAAVLQRCLQHIDDFATEGLRTLLYGYRFLDEDEYASWKKVYLDATTAITDRERLIENAGALIEQNFELGGATAIEDKLQVGVPEAIDKLRRAHIKLWMLTGDKRETAINIGHSCRLIKDYSTVIILDQEAGNLEQTIAATVLNINEGKVAHSVVVIDGQTLSTVDSDIVKKKLFLDLAVLTDTVICCRASPSQKAGLVRAIRKKVKAITLAIGDGANDIAMIQEAHVGIGITGKEGMQAARTSDYSIAQFRFLTKLLLVHGRWNYVRIAKYCVATFYKEMLFYLTQALYQRWVGYTGTSLYESWGLSMFNTLFTSLPVIFLGIFEKDLRASTLIAVPELYNKGQRNSGLNFWIYLAWMFMAATESIIIYFTALGLFGLIPFTDDNSLYALGVLTYSACIIMISTKLQLIEMHNKSIMAAISFVLSVGGWFLWNILLSLIYTNNVIYYVKHAFLFQFGRNPTWWLTLIVILTCCTLCECGICSLRAAYFATDVDIFQEFEKDPVIRERFESASFMEMRNSRPHQSIVKAQGTSKSETSIPDFAKREQDPKRTASANVSYARDESPGKSQSRRTSIEIQEMISRRFGSVRNH